MRMRDRKGIVVGASGGIGSALCRALFQEGADVLVGYRSNQAEAEGLVAEAKRLGREAIAHRVDVMDRDQIQAMVGRAKEAFGRIDFFVTTVGIDRLEWFMKQSEEEMDQAIDLEYRSVVRSYRAVLEVMVAQKSGRLLTIGSDSGKVGAGGLAVSSGARGAVIAFTKAIAREMARYSITANVLCPGPTETELNERQQKLSDTGAKVIGALNRMVPLGRMAKPEEIAWPALFLISDEASFITGQALSVSGGMSM